MITAWTGEDWENHCMTLLNIRYSQTSPHSLQQVPAKVKGDLGIEAFTTLGAVYQCYAAEEPLSPQARYEHQRDKLTQDLRKLRHNSTQLSLLLGSIKINRYVFLVPLHDNRELINHATKKEEEIKSWGLPFIREDFRIIIETESSYQNELNQLNKIPDPAIPTVSVLQEDVSEWSSENRSFIQTIDNKLNKVLSDERTIESAIISLVEEYISGEAVLQRIKENFPDTHQSILAISSTKERRLVLNYPPEENQKYSVIQLISTDLSNSLRELQVGIGDSHRETLAWRTVADWLMRCPLDFTKDDT